MTIDIFIQEIIKLGSGAAFGLFYTLVIMGALVGRDFLKADKKFAIILSIGGAINYFLFLGITEIFVHYIICVLIFVLSGFYFCLRKGYLK